MKTSTRCASLSKQFQFDDDENFFQIFQKTLEDAIFNDWDADPLTLDDFKEGIKEFKSNYTVVDMRNVWIKYFEFDAQRNNVQSWWRVEVTAILTEKHYFSCYVQSCFQ